MRFFALLVIIFVAGLALLSNILRPDPKDPRSSVMAAIFNLGVVLAGIYLYMITD